jgi:glutamate racemase
VAKRRRPARLGPDPGAPIGVFDSGIGGLTVVRALRRRLPGESIVYFGDPARFPYGTKSAETILRFAVEDAGFLLSRGVKMVIVACHSASSSALPELERRLPVPVLGVVEPGARAAVRTTKSNRIAVIGTSATITSGAYEQAIRRLEQNVEIVAKPTPLFVPLAEEGWLDNDVAEVVARRYLAGLADEGVDTLLLGCTHFPLLARVIGRVVGPAVTLVDSAEETAASAEELLAAKGLLSPGGPVGHRFYLSDLAPNFQIVGERFLGEPMGDVNRASVGGASSPVLQRQAVRAKGPDRIHRPRRRKR